MPNIIKLIIIFSRVKKPFPSSAREPKKHVLCSSTKRKAKCHVVNVTTEVAGPSMRWNWPELLPDTAVTVSPEHLEPFQKWQLKVISRVIKIGKHTKSSLFWYWAGAEERDRACHVRRNQFIAVEKEEERERERESERQKERAAGPTPHGTVPWKSQPPPLPPPPFADTEKVCIYIRTGTKLMQRLHPYLPSYPFFPTYLHAYPFLSIYISIHFYLPNHFLLTYLTIFSYLPNHFYLPTYLTIFTTCISNHCSIPTKPTST